MFSLHVDDEIKLILLEQRHVKRLVEIRDNSREYLRQWLTWLDIATTDSHAERFIARNLQQFANNDGFKTGIFNRGELVGMIGLQGINYTTRAATIGYWLAEAYQKRGIMRRACAFVVDYCFSEYGLNRIEILAASGNGKSRAIPKNLGFTQEGIFRDNEWLYDHYVDNVIYSKLRADWEKERLNR